jgi:hypothetical protein
MAPVLARHLDAVFDLDSDLADETREERIEEIVGVIVPTAKSALTNSGLRALHASGQLQRAAVSSAARQVLGVDTS